MGTPTFVPGTEPVMDFRVIPEFFKNTSRMHSMLIFIKIRFPNRMNFYLGTSAFAIPQTETPFHQIDYIDSLIP